MTQASEVIAQQYAAAGINKITWGSIGVNVKEFGAVGDGVTDDTQAFNRAMNSITGEGTILLPPGTYRIASSMTIPSRICTYFTNGGMIAPGSGATVTINGEIIAELTQIFAGLGTVSGSMKVPYVYPQWWGAKGDGVTDDTASVQKAVNLDGPTVFFTTGRYKVGYLQLSTQSNVCIQGSGLKNTIFIPNGNNVAIFSWDQADSYSVRQFSNFGIDGTGFTGCSGFNVVRGRKISIDNIYFKDVFYGVTIDRGHEISISNISQDGTVAYRFESTDTGAFLKDVTIQNVQHDEATVNLTVPWFTFNRCVNVFMSNVVTEGLTGSNIGVLISDQCEGVFMTNVIIPWPLIGVKTLAVSGRSPYDVYLENVSVDQFLVSGLVVEALRTKLSNCLFVNGFDRSNTGPGIDIIGTSDDVKISNTGIGRNNYDGIRISSTATNIDIVNSSFTGNGMVSGYDLNVAAGAKYDNPRLVNCRLGTFNIPGQLIANGNSSKYLFYTGASTQTTAVIIEQSLNSYTMSANTLKANQKLRIKAFGVFAANANTKTLRLYFGSNVIQLASGAFNGVSWNIDTEILYNGTSAQKANSTILYGTSLLATSTTTTVDTTAAVTFNLTGQNGTASAGDIVCFGMTIELL